MTGSDIYKRTAVYERDAATLRLYPQEWKLLLAFDGQRTLEETARSSETSPADALRHAEKFLQNGWIEEQPITLDQYLKRTGTTERTSTVPLASVSHPPQPEPALQTPTASATPPTPPSDKPKERVLRLGAVIDHLLSLADSRSLGYFLAYRVFLRVPLELLQAEEIASVHLAGEAGLARGEKLQQAIAQAVQAIARQPLPESAFASA